MNAHDIKLSNGIKTFTGKLIVADNALYFLCASTGSALLDGAAIGLLGAKGNRGWLINAFDTKSKSITLPLDLTENDLNATVTEMPGSIIFEAKKIEIIKQNWAVKMIKWDGKKMGVPSGFSKELIKDLTPWAKKWNIPTSGI
jgi:hypothetical protein